LDGVNGILMQQTQICRSKTIGIKGLLLPLPTPYSQLWSQFQEGDERCKEVTSGAYLLCNLSPQVNQVMSKADK
jgi:hypothetical protein